MRFTNFHAPSRVLVAGIYVAAPTPGLRQSLHARHAQLLEFEISCGFDPVCHAKDLVRLQRLLDPGERKP